MKGRYLVSLLLPLILFGLSCSQQPERKGPPEKVIREKPASAKAKPLKIIHVAGEMIRVDPKTSKLTIRGKDGDVEIYVTKRTTIHIGRDPSRLSDIAAGSRATVKYLDIDGENIARSIFIVQETPDDVKSQNVEVPSPKPPEKMAPAQPPPSPPRAWPSS